MAESTVAASYRPSAALAHAARRLVDRYDFSADVAVELLHQSENTMYLVRDPSRSEKFVLRIHSHRMSYHTEPSILSELQWMAALRRDAAIETPEVVPGRDGSRVQSLSEPGRAVPRLAVMFTFLEGVEPPAARLAPEFERLGEITARMHRHAQGWRLPDGFHRHSWIATTILGERPLWGRWQSGVGMDTPAVRLIDRMARVIDRRLAGLARDRERFGLIHADMRLANLLVEGERTKVIDFDDCGFGWFAYDLATALSFIQERADAPALVEAWLAGYGRSMRLPPDILAEIPTLIMLRRVAEIAWLGTTQHVDFARALAPRFAGDTCRLAEDYLQRFG
jgi:Ser/Thr protein kinase RdoA (MazF antagonist)